MDIYQYLHISIFCVLKHALCVPRSEEHPAYHHS